MAVMRLSATWDGFRRNLYKAFPKPEDQSLLDFEILGEDWKSKMLRLLLAVIAAIIVYATWTMIGNPTDGAEVNIGLVLAAFAFFVVAIGLRRWLD